MSLITMCLAYGQRALRTWKRNEQGASFVEYALLAALIAVVCILAISFVGSATSRSFSSSGSQL